MLGGIAPPDLAAARVQDSEEEARQRERIWYVACTRARDLLILPNIPQAKNNSWFKAIDLRREDVPELNLENLPSPPRALSTRDENRQERKRFFRRAGSFHCKHACPGLATP